MNLPESILDNIKNSNMLKNKFTVEDCYNDAWGTQETKIDDYIPSEGNSIDNYKHMKVSKAYLEA